METIQITDPRVQLVGRIATENSATDGAHFYWPGSYARVAFTGTTLKVKANVHVLWGSNSLGVVLDGRCSKIPVKVENNGKEMTIELANNLPAEEVHTCLLYKVLDCSYDYHLLAFETDGAFVAPSPLPQRRLEFYGDSVTAGQVLECVDYVGRTDPPSHDSCYDNAWYSYAWMTARKLEAQAHLTAQGGIAILDKTGYFHWPDVYGMEQTWDRLCYFPEAGTYTKWDFSKYIPDAVCFAIAQNDHHDAVRDVCDLTVSDPAHRTRWQEAYKTIIRGIASKYPAGTPFVLMTTVLMHNKEWDEAITEIKDSLCAEGLNVHQFFFSRNGAATPGHPRIPEQQEMAEELAAYLKELLGW